MNLPFWRKRSATGDASREPQWCERVDWRALGITAAPCSRRASCVALLLRLRARPPGAPRAASKARSSASRRPRSRASSREVAHGGLASVDLDADPRARSRAIDWVDNAVVTRVWPDAIRVVIIEQVAAARWNDTGLLNTRGELFIRNARYVPPELPLLEGPRRQRRRKSRSSIIDAQGRAARSRACA